MIRTFCFFGAFFAFSILICKSFCIFPVISSAFCRFPTIFPTSEIYFSSSSMTCFSEKSAILVSVMYTGTLLWCQKSQVPTELAFPVKSKSHPKMKSGFMASAFSCPIVLGTVIGSCRNRTRSSSVRCLSSSMPIAATICSPAPSSSSVSMEFCQSAIMRVGGF